MPDAGKDAEEKWSDWKPVIKELLGTVEVWWERTRGKEYQSITFGEITRELNALQQQLADVRQERDRYLRAVLSSPDTTQRRGDR